MFDRLKGVLVESFVGAIALGYLLGEVALYLVSAFTSPVSVWTRRSLSRGSTQPTAPIINPVLQAALSPALGFVLLFLLWYVLVRWLYFTPVKKEASATSPEQTG